MNTSVTVIGGGMIVHDQILPSLYQFQRLGRIGEITVCSQRRQTVQALRAAPMLQEAFPGQSFRAFPVTGNEPQPEGYRAVIASQPGQGIVIVAVPDPLHYEVVLAAIAAGQHVICVKPLVLTVRESEQIESAARAEGLFVGIEYHKRFDDRSLLARQQFRAGRFGEFKLGTAALLEKWYYRSSNFQNWCTTEASDAFTYIGCHYVDLVHFLTGLQPTAVSVYGIPDRYPNGNVGYLWTDARVLWSNGACLNVQNALGFPDAAPGSNTQGLTMYCSDGDRGAWLQHSDQYRGLQHTYTRASGAPGSTVHAEPSPDYFQYVDLGGPGLVPVGYGYRSIEALVTACQQVAQADDRTALLDEIDRQGVLATPANSRHNERVIEAARESLRRGGELVRLP